MREMLKARNETTALRLLGQADATLVRTGYDNWDGGTDLWELVLHLRPEEFAVLPEAEVEAASASLAKAAKELTARLQGHGLQGVRVAPSLERVANSGSDQVVADLSHLLAVRGLSLGRELGSGSYGRVFHSTHSALGHERAVKVFAPSALVQGSRAKLERALLRFQREAQVLARIRHPAVVRLFDAHLSGDVRFIITDYCEGETAKTVVEQGLLSFDAAVAIVKPLLEALVEVHSSGVLHRDIAPKNVIVQEGPNPKPVLIDFGLSGLLEADLAERLTTTAVGTPGFWAPELVADPTCQDPRVDVYSVGALLHYLITGRPPNQADPDRLLRAHGIEPRRIVTIEAGFASQVTRRYPTALAFLNALRALDRADHGTHAPAQSQVVIDDETVQQLLGLGRSRPEIESIVQQAHLSLCRRAPEKYAAERDAYLATLLCGVRQWVRLFPDGRWAESWQEEDDFVRAVAQLLAIRSGEVTADQRKAREALGRATQVGWLIETEYDAWRPGMRSGTGMRSQYQVSALGKQLLADSGVEIRQPR
jgi:serine/threonine protein kinase